VGSEAIDIEVALPTDLRPVLTLLRPTNAQARAVLVSQQVQSLVLKLLKKQVRYLPRKWKQANMKKNVQLF